VSNLDEESRWTVHYTAPWHQQENVFLPSTRPPCVEDLHRQAKLNLKSVLRVNLLQCQAPHPKSFSGAVLYYSPTTGAKSPWNWALEIIHHRYFIEFLSFPLHGPPTCLVLSRTLYLIPSPEEEKLISIKRSRTPISNECCDIDTQTNWTKSLPLPTPEEKMRQQAQAVQTDVVPINVTGENFDRQASIRRSLIYTDTVVRRPKKVKRRKTITGVPDNIQKELGTTSNPPLWEAKQVFLCPNRDSYRSAMQRSETKDTSCQTEEVKVVPPSVRRIRAQKGQGIAAQMSQFSSSSGNMSVMSDSAGVIFVSRLNNDMGFHSLPRPGARVSLQSLEQRQSISNQTEDITGTLSHQISKLQVDNSVVHIRNNPRTGTLPRPKSQEVRSYESEKAASPACVVSPHSTYSTSIIPNATISSSSEVIVIHTTQISMKEDHHSSSGNWSESSSTRHSQTSDTISSNATMMLSLGDSAVSLSTPGNVENGSQSMSDSCRNNLPFQGHSQDSDGRSESSFSGDRSQSNSINSTEHWVYKSRENDETPSHKPAYASAGYSTPVSNVSSSSLERTSVKEDSSSLYSLDHDGYYTTMHMDSGLKSGKLCNSNNGFGNPRHSVINVFDGNEKKNQDERSSNSDKSLIRNISLKKAKKPPLPPSRTDSLRRIPKKKTQSSGQVLDETLIATLQHSLQLNLPCKNGSSPSQSPCSDYEDPWVLRSRSQSSVSASSSMMSTTAPNMYSLCTVTPSQSDTSSIKSEYADQWGYYSDYAGMPEDQFKCPVARSASTTATLNDYSISHLNDGSRASTPSTPQVASGLAKPKNTSPEKSHRVTSPSSGYSSQSNTPTALTPVPVFLKSTSPANGKPKLKPKVPERKSSLLSSVSISSSSTSLSSNTSNEGTPPLDPKLTQDATKFTPYSFKKCNQDDSGYKAVKQPANKQDSSRPVMPLITTKALQMVQLRSVKKCTGAQTEQSAGCISEANPQEKATIIFSPQPPLKPSLSLRLSVSLDEETKTHSPSFKNLVQTPPQSSLPDLSDSAPETSSGQNPGNAAGLMQTFEADVLGTNIEEAPQSPVQNEKSHSGLISTPFQVPSGSPSKTQGISPNKKPPPISKKPKLFLIVPPPQLDFTAEKTANVSDPVRGTSSPTRREIAHYEEAKNCLTDGLSSNEMDSGSLVPEGGAAGSTFFETVETNVCMVQPAASPVQEAPKQEQQTTLDEGSSSDSNGDDSSNTDRHLSQEDESGNEEVATPARPRTTEDLFAAIHRSKRKVLGRKDSEDDRTRNHSPSPPVTPTGASPNLASLKHAGSIQRSIRKSSTSNDNFKALLLKKGSRSDTSSRMSAAEMLKNTDPRFHRTKSDSALEFPDSPVSCSSSKNKRAQEEWAKSEGLMPRSMSFSSTRYGRSRTPPSAASSKYNVRNRIQSSPMTVISEGDGE
ncbi:NHS-like protein 1, partial [Chelonia mydas]